MANSSHGLGEEHSKMWKRLQKNELGNVVIQGREEIGVFSAFLVLDLCWRGLSQVYQAEEQSLRGRVLSTTGQDRVKGFSGELDRHKSTVGSWLMLL